MWHESKHSNHKPNPIELESNPWFTLSLTWAVKHQLKGVIRWGMKWWGVKPWEKDPKLHEYDANITLLSSSISSPPHQAIWTDLNQLIASFKKASNLFIYMWQLTKGTPSLNAWNGSRPRHQGRDKGVSSLNANTSHTFLKDKKGDSTSHLCLSPSKRGNFITIFSMRAAHGKWGKARRRAPKLNPSTINGS